MDVWVHGECAQVSVRMYTCTLVCTLQWEYRDQKINFVELILFLHFTCEFWETNSGCQAQGKDPRGTVPQLPLVFEKQILGQKRISFHLGLEEPSRKVKLKFVFKSLLKNKSLVRTEHIIIMGEEINYQRYPYHDCSE